MSLSFLPSFLSCNGQAKTRKLAERRVSKEEVEDVERRRRAEEAEDRKELVRTMRWVAGWAVGCLLGGGLLLGGGVLAGQRGGACQAGCPFTRGACLPRTGTCPARCLGSNPLQLTLNRL